MYESFLIDLLKMGIENVARILTAPNLQHKVQMQSVLDGT